MNMIEKVAREYSQYCYGDPSCWKEFLTEARLAIKAMREPNDRMLLARRINESRSETWEAMIDAALKE